MFHTTKYMRRAPQARASDGHGKQTDSYYFFANLYLRSQQGQSHHQRWVGQTWRVQEEIGIARNMPVAYDKRTRVVSKQQLLARQKRRREVCGHRKRSSPQVVDAVRNVMQQ